MLEIDVEYLKRLDNLHNDLAFLPERMNIKKCNAIFMIKATMLHT